jgi:hypothetical protein
MKFIETPNPMGGKPVQTTIWAVVKERLHDGCGYGANNGYPDKQILALEDMVGRLVQVLAEKDVLHDDDVRRLAGFYGKDEDVKIVDIDV